MKCKRFKISNLRNEEWFQFLTEFKRLVEQYTAETLEIETLFTLFIRLYGDADEALENIKKSATTEQLVESDKRRDNIFRGFSSVVRSSLNHFDVEKRDAAKRIQVIFDKYGDIARKGYDQETASIYNFLQDINEKEQDVTLLGFNDWIDQLHIENTTFDALMKSRYEEMASKTLLKIREIRMEAERCYLDILDRLDALMIVKGEEKYAPFVKEFNVIVERFSTQHALRIGLKRHYEKKRQEKETIAEEE